MLRQLFTCILCMSTFAGTLFAQQSLLVNLGSTDCATPENPSFSIIKSPLTTPSVMNNCNLASQLPDFFNTFIAYNPKDNKIYVNDVRNADSSRIWIMDVGLPNNIACPAIIPINPNFAPAYNTNNFEFDNFGNLWSLRNYNYSTGQCLMDKYDIITGTILSSKILQFPIGHQPSDIGNGDLSILPNGRLFATFGVDSSILYEITNYSTTIGNATATYLKSMPKNTYGIAYLNGQLELTGTNTVNDCYYYIYNIATNTLSDEYAYQNGQSPIDNTSFSPVVGLTKQLISAQKINNNTADLVYEIYVRNLGNVILNNLSVIDDLGAVFGSSNVSNVTTNFVPGFNTPGFTLNSSYNGTTVTNILNTGQSLHNQTSTAENYFFKVQIHFRVTNLIANTIYYNSAIGNANIGSGVNLINVTDSSNNGPSTVVDPNNNGIPNELDENVPTPFDFNSITPVRFINQSVTKNNTQVKVEWEVATPIINGQKFVVEVSDNGMTWNTVGDIAITNPSVSRYQLLSSLNTGSLYRIKQIDADGYTTYSNIVRLAGSNTAMMMVYPNPAKDHINFIPFSSGKKYSVKLYDATGKLLQSLNNFSNATSIDVSPYSKGTYLLKINEDEKLIETKRIVIAH